jgi:hypothetical protein
VSARTAARAAAVYAAAAAWQDATMNYYLRVNGTHYTPESHEERRRLVSERHRDLLSLLTGPLTAPGDASVFYELVRESDAALYTGALADDGGL